MRRQKNITKQEIETKGFADLSNITKQQIDLSSKFRITSEYLQNNKNFQFEHWEELNSIKSLNKATNYQMGQKFKNDNYVKDKYGAKSFKIKNINSTN